MRESCTYGSVRGARGNSRPYRDRREFIALVGGAAAWPLAARAQQPAKVYRIAVVSPAIPIAEMNETSSYRSYRALFRELRRLGHIEGQNLVVERYSGEGRTEHYADLAREAVRLKPDLILASSIAMVLPFKAATADIPIVGIMGYPVEAGLAASLARPGGNITGVSVDAGIEIWSKRLEFLREIVPSASRVGLLGIPFAWEHAGAVLREAARQMGMSLVGTPLEGTLQESEYRRVFEAITQQRPDAMVVGPESENLANARLIVELAEKARLPAIYPLREFPEAGGLMAYAFDLGEVYHRAAGYIDQILKGANAGEIPIYQMTKFELVINVKAAEAIGLAMPPSLLLRADEVIE
jgi:putative ABC transport system substrate-binding protein